MNPAADAILFQYENYLESYQTIERIVTEKLQSFVSEIDFDVDGIKSRVKTYESLSGKLALKGDKYHSIEDITDIVGVRVIVYYSDQIDKIAAKVESAFNIDWNNSVDKRKALRIDQFGYISLHYICSIPESLYKDENHPEINRIRFEIQLRTVLQHAWASIAHDTGYKSDIEVPSEYLRSLNRLAGLLELADESFASIRTSLNKYRQHVRKLVQNGDLSSVELNMDTYEAYLENGGFSSLNNRIASINDMDVEEVSLRNYLKVFKAFGFATLKDLDNFVKKYSDMAYQFGVREFDGRDLDIMTSATAPLMLCVVYILSEGMGENVVHRFLDSVLGERKSNARQAKRLTNIGRSMGIIQD